MWRCLASLGTVRECGFRFADFIYVLCYCDRMTNKGTLVSAFPRHRHSARAQNRQSLE